MEQSSRDPVASLSSSNSDNAAQRLSLDWANAPEFVPLAATFPKVENQEVSFSFPALVEQEEEAGPSTPQQPVKSYAKAVDPSAGQSFKIAQSTAELCPYLFMGFCRYAEECTYIHGDLCELCGQYCLHPTDEVQRSQHNQVYLQLDE